MKRVAVLVAGMHRSGTSALTRLCVGLGCDAPRTPMQADAHNALGYWESSVIAELNEAVLASAGSSWDDSGPFNAEWHASPAAAPYRERALEALEREFGDSPLFVLKDPRICRLLTFWKAALAQFGAAPRIAIPVRNPMEVAASLAQRDLIEEPLGALLWLRNVLDAEASCRDDARAFIRYDDLLANWESAAERLGRELSIAWPRRSGQAALDIDENLPRSLRHQVRADADVHDAPAVADWVKATYAILTRWARDDVRAGDAASLEATRAAFDAAEAAFRRPLALGLRARQREARLDVELTERRREMEALAAEIHAKDSQLADLGGALTERDVRIDALEHQVLGRDGQIDAKDRQLAELGSTLTERDGRIDGLETQVRDQDKRIDAAEVRSRARAQEIDALLASTSWRITRPLRGAKRLWAAASRNGAQVLGFAFMLPARLAWRLLPLPKARKESIRRAALQRLPKRLAGHNASLYDRAGGYVHASRLDLADYNHRAAQGKGAVPILFDGDWYLANNEDVRLAGVDPLAHYLEGGAAEGRLPMPIEPDDIEPMIESLHRLNLKDPGAFRFDGAFYKVLYPDLASLDDAALAQHHEAHGRAESRVASKGEFVDQLCRHPAEIPLDFHADEYIDLYPDLSGFAERPALEALRHYMLHGRWEPRLHTLRGDAPSPTRQAAEAPPIAGERRPLCVLAHVYYPDLWPELCTYIDNLPPVSYDLYVNLVDATFSQELLAAIRAAYPTARVYISENIGRDIGGYFQLLGNIRMEDYAAFCLLHTKRSPHMAPGEVQRWRRKLLMPLLGSPERASENLELMCADDAIGQLGAEACRYAELNDNPEKYFDALKRLGIHEDAAPVEFLSGTMMFVRSEVLRRVFECLRDVPFEAGDGGSLAFHRDGQWAHAVERAIGAVVRDMGYRFEWRAAEGA